MRLQNEIFRGMWHVSTKKNFINGEKSTPYPTKNILRDKLEQWETCNTPGEQKIEDLGKHFPTKKSRIFEDCNCKSSGDKPRNYWFSMICSNP